MSNTVEKALLNARNFVKNAAERITQLESELQAYQRREESHKIARQMLDKGMIAPEDYLDTVEKIASSNKDLNVLSEAIEMNNGNVGLTLVVSDNSVQNTKTAGIYSNAEEARQAAIDGILSTLYGN